VVGDYLFDLLSAKAAGAAAVLLANHERADEFARHADFTIQNIRQVLQIVQDKK
jgi:phosphoglycolate phosphatase-like HAD superfamily hydrolase